MSPVFTFEEISRETDVWCDRCCLLAGVRLALAISVDGLLDGMFVVTLCAECEQPILAGGEAD